MAGKRQPGTVGKLEYSTARDLAGGLLTEVAPHLKGRMRVTYDCHDRRSPDRVFIESSDKNTVAILLEMISPDTLDEFGPYVEVASRFMVQVCGTVDEYVGDWAGFDRGMERGSMSVWAVFTDEDPLWRELKKTLTPSEALFIETHIEGWVDSGESLLAVAREATGVLNAN